MTTVARTRDPEADAREAATKARALLGASRSASPDDPYITRKQIAPDGLLEIDLAVAVRIIGYAPKGGKHHKTLAGPSIIVAPILVDANISTVEFIDAAGTKSFLAGGTMAAGFWAPRPLPDCDWAGDMTILVGEGCATVASAAMACPNSYAVAAMSAGNLLAVGKMLRERYPDARIVYLGDVGIGAHKCMEAARATGGFVAVPPIDEDGADWNDVHVRAGLLAVAAGMDTAQQPAAEPVEAEVVAPGAARTARCYALTETGGAELLADRLAGDWRYCQDRGQWVRWTGQVWTFDPGDVAITERSKLVAQEFLAEAQWALKADDARAKVFAQFAATAQRRQFRRAVIDLAKSEPGILIPFSEFDCDAYLLNAANGTVDLHTGKLRPHSREDKITRILPWSYDPDATCPRWERFLGEILPDAETVEFVRRAIGYTLTADVSEHVLFSCFGAGANGKSVLLNTLLHVFGPYGTTAPTSMLVAKQHESHPTEKMVLVGKRLVVFQEIPSGQRLNEGLTKALVSGDPDQARAMRENFTTIRPVGKLWLAGNHRLDIREQTEAIWRRYREIPFEQVFSQEQRDPKLETKLREEATGALAWCVRGCLEWQRAGLGKSGKVQAATADLRAEMDRLGPFLEECCIVSPSATVPRAALFQAYRLWAERQGSHGISDKAFTELVRGRGFTPAYGRVNGKTARVWHGLGLIDGVPPSPHLPQIPKESPYCGQNQSLREGYREEVSESVASVAPDPLAQLAHCLRVRPDTTATDPDREALAEHFRGLNGTAEAAGQRLWAYWKAAPSPTVSEFLAKEPKAKCGAA